MTTLAIVILFAAGILIWAGVTGNSVTSFLSSVLSKPKKQQ